MGKKLNVIDIIGWSNFQKHLNNEGKKSNYTNI